MRTHRERSPRRDFGRRDYSHYKVRRDDRQFKRFNGGRDHEGDQEKREILNQLAGETFRKENDRTWRFSRPQNKTYASHKDKERKWRNDRREDGRDHKKREDKPMLKLENPDLVPKASRYFLHDNRTEFVPRKRFGRRFDSRREQSSFHNGSQRDSQRTEDPTKNRWTHDKFAELMDEEQ
ncbi:unnamed protein product [Bursaphelenchus xylophilus]|uniref:(pine wood nematode) hypothetical protein n=1 Tax=Bursaphelenchus xylophilus TaxID=6326 RepID=A0A1I7RJZ0_BURXY|nr:unnamed protein product [Bursaphelenchus xylophilus]CAG9131627.1 unnamed protein product [Bursaphelenchus xylophilus]